jgi:hydrogenase maturation protease
VKVWQESWKGTDLVIIVDEASLGAKPGTVHCIDARAQQIQRGLLYPSTHAFSVGDAIELARVMDQLPPRMLIYVLRERNSVKEWGYLG